MSTHQMVKLGANKALYCHGCAAWICELCRTPMRESGHSCSIAKGAETPKDERHV